MFWGDNVNPMKVAKRLLLALVLAAITGIALFTLLVWRGFRASTTPSAVEITVARAARNFAIPSRERNAANPVAPSPEADRQGRDQFMTRCAACHAIDGSGKTQVGVNLYPRVPDLGEPRRKILRMAKFTTSSKTASNIRACPRGIPCRRRRCGARLAAPGLHREPHLQRHAAVGCFPSTPPVRRR